MTLPHWNSDFTFAALIGSANFVSIWVLFYVQTLHNRRHSLGIKDAVRAAVAGITSSRENRARIGEVGAEIVAATDAIITSAVAATVSQVTATAADAAATLAGHTPTSGVSLPAELRRVVAAATAATLTSPD